MYDASAMADDPSTHRSRRTRIVAVAVLVVVVVAAAFAQRRSFGGGRFAQLPIPPNVPYDGRFAFVRVKYETAVNGDVTGLDARSSGATRLMRGAGRDAISTASQDSRVQRE